MFPIAQPVVIIHRSFVYHPTFLHHASRSGILDFTFCVDQPGSQDRKGIGKSSLKRFRQVTYLSLRVEEGTKQEAEEFPGDEGIIANTFITRSLQQYEYN